jgi:hypothetical protein
MIATVSHSPGFRITADVSPCLEIQMTVLETCGQQTLHPIREHFRRNALFHSLICNVVEMPVAGWRDVSEGDIIRVWDDYDLFIL